MSLSLALGPVPFPRGPVSAGRLARGRPGWASFLLGWLAGPAADAHLPPLLSSAHAAPAEAGLASPARSGAAPRLGSTSWGGEARFDGQRHAEFHRLIIPQIDAAYNLARYLARDAEAAHDIVQDAFLKAYRGFGGYRGENARAWLLAIVRNCCRDWLAERARRTRFEVEVEPRPTLDDEGEPGPEDWVSEDDTPEEALLRKSEAETARSLLLRLASPLREVLILRELEGLSYREIAEVTTVPIGTVMSRLARARRALADAWFQQAADEEAGA